MFPWNAALLGRIRFHETTIDRQVLALHQSHFHTLEHDLVWQITLAVPSRSSMADRRYGRHPFDSQIFVAVCDEVVPQAKPAECDGGGRYVYSILGAKGSGVIWRMLHQRCGRSVPAIVNTFEQKRAHELTHVSVTCTFGIDSMFRLLNLCVRWPPLSPGKNGMKT
jgi:hypothetical protein